MQLNLEDVDATERLGAQLVLAGLVSGGVGEWVGPVSTGTEGAGRAGDGAREARRGRRVRRVGWRCEGVVGRGEAVGSAAWPSRSVAHTTPSPSVRGAPSTTQWESILHVGDEDAQRMPALWWKTDGTDGVHELPFEFPLEQQAEKLFETYHGVFVNVQYVITVEVRRGMLAKNLKRSIEFILEAPDSRALKPSPALFALIVTPGGLASNRIGGCAHNRIVLVEEKILEEGAGDVIVVARELREGVDGHNTQRRVGLECAPLDLLQNLNGALGHEDLERLQRQPSASPAPA